MSYVNDMYKFWLSDDGIKMTRESYQRVINKWPNREVVKDEMFDDDNYIKWLEDFTNKENFNDRYCFDFLDSKNQELKDNFNKIKLLFEAVSDYAKEYPHKDNFILQKNVICLDIIKKDSLTIFLICQKGLFLKSGYQF